MHPLAMLGFVLAIGVFVKILSAFQFAEEALAVSRKGACTGVE